jgi:hypothetical protein
MACDLESIFGPLVGQVPTVIDGDAPGFVFSASNLPVPPERMDTDRLVVRRTWRTYNYHNNEGYPVDGLVFQAKPETYRHLGLLIVAVVFHEQPVEVHLTLAHPASEIRELVVEYEHPNVSHFISGYQTRPFQFSYAPQETNCHPWYSMGRVPIEDLPSFGLTSALGVNLGPGRAAQAAQWAAQDRVWVFGSDRALVNLAELLLNVGRPENPVLQYELEGEGGFRGVGVHSAEVILCLPGSDGWDAAL